MVREFHDDAGATRGRNWGYDSRARFIEGDLYRANYDAIRWGSDGDDVPADDCNEIASSDLDGLVAGDSVGLGRRAG